MIGRRCAVGLERERDLCSESSLLLPRCWMDGGSSGLGVLVCPPQSDICDGCGDVLACIAFIIEATCDAVKVIDETRVSEFLVEVQV